MRQIIKDNSLFFTGLLVFLIVGGIILLDIERGDAIRFFSERRTEQANWFFIITTKLGEEYIYYLLFIIFLFIRFRYAFLVLLTGVLALGFSYLLKELFAHDRPFTFFMKIGDIRHINLIDGVDLNSGLTSFPSGHTLSAFAIYGLLTFLFAKNKFLGLFFFFIALIVGISRVYLVQHFLQDIYLGAILGVLLAFLIYKAQVLVPYDSNTWVNRSILHLFKTRD